MSRSNVIKISNSGLQFRKRDQDSKNNTNTNHAIINKHAISFIFKL